MMRKTEQRKSYVTIENFDESRIVLGDIVAATKPVAYQRIQIRYNYPDSSAGPLLVRTPTLFSFGVCENRDMATNKHVGYSMPFVCFDSREGKTDEEEKFIEMMTKITECIRIKVAELIPKLKKGGRKKLINTDDLHILKYKDDDPGTAPVIFAKLFTENKGENIKISTTFYKRRSEKDIKKGIPAVKTLKGLVKTNGHDYIKKKCKVVGGLKIDGVFIGAMIESIQVRLTEAVIVKKVQTFNSIMGEDLDFDSDSDPETSESESEEDNDEVVQKPKKEVLVKRPNKKQVRVDPEDDVGVDEDDDDEAEEPKKKKPIKQVRVDPEDDDDDEDDIAESLQNIKRH